MKIVEVDHAGQLVRMGLVKLVGQIDRNDGARSAGLAGQVVRTVQKGEVHIARRQVLIKVRAGQQAQVVQVVQVTQTGKVAQAMLIP